MPDEWNPVTRSQHLRQHIPIPSSSNNTIWSSTLCVVSMCARYVTYLKYKFLLCFDLATKAPGEVCTTDAKNICGNHKVKASIFVPLDCKSGCVDQAFITMSKCYNIRNSKFIEKRNSLIRKIVKLLTRSVDYSILINWVMTSLKIHYCWGIFLVV